MYRKHNNKNRIMSDEQAEELIKSLYDNYSDSDFDYNYNDNDSDINNYNETAATNESSYSAYYPDEEIADASDYAEKISEIPSQPSSLSQRKTAVKKETVKKEASRQSVFAKISLLVVSIILSSWLLPSGNVMNLQSASQVSKDRSSFFITSSGNLLSDALSDIHSIPRQYILDMSDVQTPQPDSEKFIKLENDERQNYDGKPIDYYKDDTIEVKCWREKRGDNFFNFAEIWIVHPSQLRRTLVDNVISKKHLDMPSNIFKRTNGVVGMSADYAAYRDVGIIMQYGEVVRKKTSPIMEDAYYDINGNLSGFDDSPSFFESEVFKKGEVIHTFSFGPVLVDDYKIKESKKLDYYICQASSIYTRAAICQFDYDKHYLLCVVEEPGLNLRQFAAELQSMGVRFAYNLDGGQTGTLLYNNRAFNKPAYGGQREVSDILYFATAVPNE
ncbi:MAG: phosphodiester glycosidase family protein [Clostridia bacterium]|nr:phosphodiester glycosidase family protein [Clostridia bacterium]